MDGLVIFRSTILTIGMNSATVLVRIQDQDRYKERLLQSVSQQDLDTEATLEKLEVGHRI